MTEKQRPANSTYKKLAVQWLNEVLFFVSSSVLVGSFVLRNPPERQAPNRYTQGVAPTTHRTAIKINGKWHILFIPTATTQKENLVFLPTHFLKRKQMPTRL